MVEGALGEMMQDRTCSTCKRVFPGGPSALYCPACRKERQRIYNNEHKRRKRLGLTRELGSSDTCERCGKLYTVQGGNQRFCEECQPIHRLEYDAQTSIVFYHQNKVEINPVRNERRRIGLVSCIICGEEFDAEGTNRLTCCEEHAQEYRNKWWINNYYKSRGGEPMPQGAMRLSDIARETGISHSTIKSRYQAGTISDPDGFTYVGDPYWFKLPAMKNKNKKSPPTS
ncbi:hypothetical protein [Paenibacillus sp. P46E]|uniref:hypothetical protein n=1 Tax=Paenibacillus sp. P46E TaxID=1349436 RepID=UPI00093DA026|nr:hypothetical protein [Paenibacillus sp. P46E]OKP97767.1 hypothetical protein A3849_13765 [Paenibacillus sp. P46E]